MNFQKNPHAARCIFCRKPMTGGADKKFCDDGCRNAFHNMKSGESYNATRKINRLLRGNWVILNDLIEVGEDRISLNELERFGFDSRFVTSMEVREDGTMVYGLYDFEFIKDVEGVIRFRRDRRFDPKNYR
jgi:hypothetical protein